MPGDETREVAAALHTSLGLVLRRLRQMKGEGGLSVPEATALARLDRLGPMSTAELARVEQISPQSMGATLTALEGRGLIARRPDPADGRRAVLSLTAAGRRVLRDRRDERTERIAKALAGRFTAAEVRRLGAAAPLLERLAEDL
jgi:DNA-binding MarR family transcriptional regulator